jgi:hypothetical protein
MKILPCPKHCKLSPKYFHPIASAGIKNSLSAHLVMPGKKTNQISTGAKKPNTTAGNKVNHPGIKYTEEELIKAVESYTKGKSSKTSLRKAGAAHRVPSSTIHGRLKGRKTRSQARESQQLLSKSEEAALAMFCQIRGWRGDPLGLVELREAVSAISGKPVGKTWHLAFGKRHPEVNFRWGKRKDSKRTNGLNRTNVETFYQLLKKILDENDIHPDNIYNMDEKGLQEGGGTIRRRVLVAAEQKVPIIEMNEDRKMVTVVECISASGYALTPLLIHEGVEKDLEWIRCSPSKAQ